MRYNDFIKPLNLRIVVDNLLLILRLLGVLFAVPVIAALAAAELRYAIIFGASGVFCFALGHFVGGRKELEIASASEPTTKESLVVVAVAYLVTALVGAIPFLFVGSGQDALFESMSGITTTGFSMFDPGTLPPSLVFFRSYLQWIGGVGITILSIVVLIGPGQNAYRLYASEFGEENIAGSVVATARIVAVIYGAITGIGFLLFLATGFAPFDALVHAMSAVSTGGYSSSAESIGYLPGPAPRIAAGVMMLAGATCFPAYYALHKRDFRSFLSDLQLRAMVLVIVGATALLYLTQGFDLPAAGRDLFHIVSATTTTGFSVEPVPDFSEGRKAILSVLMFLGGSAGSTAGGLKILRALILFKTVRWFLLKHFLPAETRIAVEVGGSVVGHRQLREVMSVLLLLLVLTTSGTIAFTLSGYPFIDSWFDTVSATSTVGLSAGIVSPALEAWQKLVVIVLMWAGRLEVVPLLVLAYPGIYKPKRNSR